MLPAPRCTARFELDRDFVRLSLWRKVVELLRTKRVFENVVGAFWRRRYSLQFLEELRRQVSPIPIETALLSLS